MIEPLFQDVFLRKSSLSFHNDVNILQMNGLQLTQQAYNKVTGVQVVEVFRDEKRLEVKSYACFFRLQCGIRLLDQAEQTDEKVFFEILVEHDVVFDSLHQLEIKQLEDFSSSDKITNAAWPYWKEHVASMCSKVGLNSLIVPPPQKNDPIKITGHRQL
ncbi:hypothetical protein AAH450_07880 [Erwinia sp. P7711]|uniref:hypothetical protein n=1 Tax=Erwinia sp. P7711 TaxID=3141451 RepID=UPI00318ABC6D